MFLVVVSDLFCLLHFTPSLSRTLTFFFVDVVVVVIQLITDECCCNVAAAAAALDVVFNLFLLLL